MAVRLSDFSPRQLARDVGRSLEAHAALRAGRLSMGGSGGPGGPGGGAFTERGAHLTGGGPVGGVPGYQNIMSPQQDTGLSPASKRSFADANEWMQAAINYIKGRIASAEWDIVPFDKTQPYDQGARTMAVQLLRRPNAKDDSWRSFIEPVIADLCILGKCGWENVPNFRGRPLSLYPFDAAYMSIDARWDGSSPTAPRYMWKEPPRYRSIKLRNDQITMPLLNPSTHRPEGWSYVDALKYTIEGDMAGNAYVRSLMRKYPPPGWLHLGDKANQKQVDSVNEQLRTNVLGRGGLLVTGMGGPGQQFFPLNQGSGRDNELMAWSRWFAHKVAVVCGLSPQDLGLTEDVNKGTGQVQADISTEGGVKGTMFIVECYINAELLPRFGDPRKTNLAMRFKELTMRDRARMAEIVGRASGGIPVVMINEGRGWMQLEPLELGNAIYAPTPNGPVALIGPDADGYRDNLTDFAAKQAAAMGKGGPVSGGEAAGGEGGKAANSDRAKAADAADLVVLRERALPEGSDFGATRARLRASLATCVKGALHEATRDLETYLRLRASITGLEDSEESALLFVAYRLSAYLYRPRGGAVPRWVESIYTGAGLPLGGVVAAAWARDGSWALQEMVNAARMHGEPLSYLESAAPLHLEAEIADIADDVALRLWRHHTRSSEAEGGS